jgi:hypothetical protein
MNPGSPLTLPALQQAELDTATLAQLFTDLAQCTRVIAVLPRFSARTLVPPQTMELEAAHAGLVDGTLRGVQVRYRYDSREWTDTLLALGPGRTRLVRINAEDIAASVAATS